MDNSFSFKSVVRQRFDTSQDMPEVLQKSLSNKVVTQTFTS